MAAIVVWDFDWSMINENTDTYVVRELAPTVFASMKRMRQQYPVWTDLMDACFLAMANDGITTQQIIDSIASIPVDVDTLALVRLLHTKGIPQLIVSDSNTVFINTVLQAHGLESIFPSSSIYTNPATMAAERLSVRRFHSSPNTHTCPRCPPNMCKGSILSSLRPSSSTVLYIGDGRGDYCPSQSLLAADFAFCRRDYALHKQLLSSPPACQMQVWSTGSELLRLVPRALQLANRQK